MHYDPAAELIADGVIFLLCVLQVHHFGCHEPGGTATRKEVLRDVHEGRQAEVRNADVLFGHLVLPEEDVFGFEITVHDATLVRVRNAFQDRAKENCSFGLRELAMLLQIIYQITSFEQLHNHVEGVVSLVDLMELDNVGVIHRSHDFDLVYERLL